MQVCCSQFVQNIEQLEQNKNYCTILHWQYVRDNGLINLVQFAVRTE